MIIDVMYLKAVKRLVKYYWHNYRWLQNIIDVIEKAELCPRDLWKTLSFAQFHRQTQILILEILNVFLWLKLSSSLFLDKIKHFSKVSSGFIYTFYNPYLSPLTYDLLPNR